MINFQDLTPAKLVEVLNNKQRTVIAIDQITANTTGNEKLKPIAYSTSALSNSENLMSFEYSTSTLLNDEIVKAQAFLTFLDIEDKQDLWNHFVLLADILQFSIHSTNTNDVDCFVEFNFN